MTPHQLAKAECCNFSEEGCIGHGFATQPDGYVANFLLETAGQPCTLAGNKPCKFFERAVLPIADQSDPHDFKLCQARREARDTYAIKIKHQQPQAARPCPICSAPMAPRRRFCEKCALDRQRAASREYHRKKTA